MADQSSSHDLGDPPTVESLLQSLDTSTRRVRNIELLGAGSILMALLIFFGAIFFHVKHYNTAAIPAELAQTPGLSDTIWQAAGEISAAAFPAYMQALHHEAKKNLPQISKVLEEELGHLLGHLQQEVSQQLGHEVLAMLEEEYSEITQYYPELPDSEHTMLLVSALQEASRGALHQLISGRFAGTVQALEGIRETMTAWQGDLQHAQVQNLELRLLAAGLELAGNALERELNAKQQLARRN